VSFARFGGFCIFFLLVVSGFDRLVVFWFWVLGVFVFGIIHYLVAIELRVMFVSCI